MGSVVLDAVSSIFASHPNHSQHASTYRDARQHHPHPSPQPPPSRSRTPSRAEAHMSAPGQQPAAAASSSSSSHGPLAAPYDFGHAAHARPSSQMQMQQQRSQQFNSAARHSSPPLAPRSAPAHGGSPQHNSAVSSSTAGRPRKIKVRDLQHIREFAGEDNGRGFTELRSRSQSRSRSSHSGGVEADEDDAGDDEAPPQYEISEMKPEDIIEMVAGLLTKITATNDRQHEHLHRPLQPPPPLVSMEAVAAHHRHTAPPTSSVLAFHGKNVPSITILSYLTRINKYCPTSYEVFLALLVYFDRMTERVNAGPMQSLRELNRQAVEKQQQSRNQSARSSSESLDKMEDVQASDAGDAQLVTPPASGSMEQAEQRRIPGTPHSRANPPSAPTSRRADEDSLSPGMDVEAYHLAHFFVVDSFNIHRLVIAGVTCASKFFSDIFYTNSRYAKVGGLPLPELNHLELQFLLLNDFRLSVPVEELEAYGTMLVEFYAREVVAQQQAAREEAAATGQVRSLSESSEDSTSTIQAAA